MALQFKRGTDAIRQTLVLQAGEPFFVTDFATIGTVPLFVGDGVTFGGVPALELQNLHELYDVTISQPASNQLLQWDSTDGRWENRSNVIIPGSLTVNGNTTIGDASGDTLTINPNVAAVPNTLALSKVDGNYNSIESVQFISHVVSAPFTYTGIQAGTPTQVLGTGMPVLEAGTTVRLSAVNGITGINTTTTYYAFDSTSSAFKLANSRANALAGTGITTTGSYTGGTQTVTVYPDTGVGSALGFVTNNNALTIKSGAFIKAVSTDITDGSEDYDFVLTLRRNGTLTDVMTLTSDGQLKLNGVNIINASGVVVAPSINTGSGTFTGLTVNGSGTVTGDLGITGTATIGGNTTIGGNATITGNLTVNGTTTNIDTVNLVVEDNIITLNKNQTGTPSPSLVSGIEIERGDQTNAVWEWNEQYQWFQTSGAAQNIWAQNNIFSGQVIGTNGLEIQFNVDNANLVNGDYANLRVKRGSAGDAVIRWNETAARWEISNGGAYISFPSQALDTTSSPTFAALTLTNGLTVTGGDVDITNNLIVRGTSDLGNDILVDTTAVKGIFQVNTNALYVTRTGLVGINRTNPTYRLDVDGVVRATDLRTSNGQIYYDANAGAAISIASNNTVNIPNNFTVTGTQTNTGAVTFNDNLTVNGTTILGNSTLADDVIFNSRINSNIEFKDVTGSTRGITGTVGGNDYWFVGGYASGANTSELIIATGDDANEPIYVRQYTGNPAAGGTVVRSLTLLDASGNTSVPGNLNVAGGTIQNTSGNLTLSASGGTIVITGNLQVDGTTTTINSTTLDVDDKNITIAKGAANAAAADGGGITLEGPTTAATILYEADDDSWNLNKDTNVAGDVTADSFSSAVYYVEDLAGDQIAATVGRTSTTTGTTTITIASTNRKLLKVLVAVDNGTDTHVIEALVMRDAADPNGAQITLYGELKTGAALATFTADYDAGTSSIRLRATATPASPTSTTFKTVRTGLF